MRIRDTRALATQQRQDRSARMVALFIDDLVRKEAGRVSLQVSRQSVSWRL
jgi:hypothetical protein